jgi:ABC-type branched-subunit amino acid transport system ATPase component/ABC-type branched-subunit amino acid transport system permease subunit
MTPTTSSRLTRLAILLAGVIALLVLSNVFPQAWPLGRIVQGLVLGAASGLLAVGLVLVYRTARMINFAYGAMGSCAAQVGIVAYNVFGVPWLVCVVIATIAGGVIGIGVDLVLRRFSNAPRLVVTVATIGLLQVLVGLQFGLAFWSGSDLLVASFRTGLSDQSFTIGTSVFTGNDVLLVALAPLALIGLATFLLRTDAGSAVRAVADNSDRAMLLGIPIRRLTRIVWILVGCLAGAVMILSAPANGLPASPFVSVGGIFMPALAAAIVAKMEDLPLAFGSGVALGIFNAIVSNNVRKASVGTVLLLVVVLAALLLRRWKATRAETAESSWSLAGGTRSLSPQLARLPEIAVPRIGILVAIVAAAGVFPLVASPSRTHTVAGYLILAIVVVSLVMLSGWAGTISLGQFAVVGVGAIVAGNAVVKWNLDLFLAMALAGAAGAAISVVIGLPALRVRPLFLAVTTAIFAATVDQYFLNPSNYPDLVPGVINRPVLWKRIPLESERAMYYLVLGTLLLSMVVARTLRNGRPGRILLAVRDNGNAASAVAVPPTSTRVRGMALAGVFAGLAGALAGVLELGIGSSSFPPQMSILVFSMAVVGGLSTVSGALAGVAAIQLLNFGIGELTSQGAQFASLGSGALMLVVLIGFPGGIGEGIVRIRDAYAARVAKRRGLVLDVGAAAGSLAAAATPPDTPVDTEVVRAGPTPTGGALLELAGVTASYGPLQVLFGVDLQIRRGEVVALLGTNGAGKSTVFKAITGLLPITGGTVRLDGASLAGRATDQIACSGLSLMPGGRGVFPTLSVDENLRLACWQIRKDANAVDAALREATTMFPILEQRGNQHAGNLSGGEQQQLSLAMALVTKPEVLFIDELSLGLAPTIVGFLCEKVKEIHATGTTIVIVEQSVNVAMQLAERAVFLEKGAVRFEGPTTALLDRPDILRSVFLGTGDTGAGAPAAEPAPSRGVGLQLSGITKSFGGVRALHEVDLAIEPGTITGLIGHNGAGKTTLFDVISGFHQPDQGRIRLGGVDITDLDPHRRAVAGLGRSFQEARLFPSLTVTESVLVALDRHIASHDWLAASLALPAAVDADEIGLTRAEELIELLGLRGYANTPISELSTGTRRIVELACILAMDPAVLLLDEPSAGVAQKDTEALGPLLRKVQQTTGAAIVVIEHDMTLLTSLCDELVAMDLGAVICRGAPAAVLAEPAVIESYLGTDPAAINRSGAHAAKRPRARKLVASPRQRSAGPAEPTRVPVTQGQTP